MYVYIHVLEEKKDGGSAENDTVESHIETVSTDQLIRRKSLKNPFSFTFLVYYEYSFF